MLYYELLVRHPDYIPAEVDLYDLGKSFVQPNETVQIHLDLQPMPESPSGQVILHDGDSYHFLTGERGQYSGGDFYMGFDESGEAQFLANNVGQRGLVDLGDIGDVDLKSVTIPEQGYEIFGVRAVVSHTYVSLGREGEEGHFIVFRVVEINPQGYVVINFVYR